MVGKRFFNGRIFKFIFNLERRRDIRTSPPPEYWKEPSTRNYNYDNFTDKSYGLEMSRAVK